MHTLTFFLFVFSTLLALTLATESQFGQPWYPEHKYKSWRRGRRPNTACTPEALKLGVLCRESIVLTNEKPMPAIVQPTLGPLEPLERLPWAGRRSAKDMWFAKFVAGAGERNENAGVDKREDVENAAVDSEERKEARANIFHHFNTQIRPSVHDSATSGPKQEKEGEDKVETGRKENKQEEMQRRYNDIWPTFLNEVERQREGLEEVEGQREA